MASDVAVFAELFDLNLRDAVGDRAEISSQDMHAAFVRALHATVCDMPRVAGCEGGEAAPCDAPVPAAPRKGIRYLVITAKAAVVAGLFRLAIFLGTGH